VTASQRLDRLIIFDLDNTLVERDRFFAEWAEAFVRERHFERATTLAILRESDEDGSAPRTLFFERLRALLMLQEPTDRLVDDYWRDQIARYRCDEDTITGLRRLRQAGYKLGIATNGGPRQLAKIRACGLEEVVDAVCVSQTVGAAKPDPRIFLAVAEGCRVSLEDAWVVGDRPETDIAGAVAIGARSVWISRGKVWVEAEFTPTFTADTVAEATSLLIAADAASVK
jgi:putative hydrolase of the HAD superfamily